MTSKIKERLVNASLSIASAFGAVFLSFALFTGDAKDIKLDDNLDGKANIEYVDKQDKQIREEISENKADNELAHKEIKENIVSGFNDLKEGQVKNTDRIIDVINEK